ncbi:MAG: hypothetical protein LBU57_04010, partial [Dysgonamonadaceae bacterium]|nr:hypothetical protein [Dysgonamonadaceae bacterium]
MSAQAQQVSFLIALDDLVSTGPMQKVKVNVLANDVVLCSDYTLHIISALNPTTQGEAIVLPGGYIEFTPGINCRNTTVDIDYKTLCGNDSATATLSVNVTEFNYPVNVIDENVSCYTEMNSDITFGIREKFKTENGSPATGYCIDGMSSPLVGDLNSDGKPEIVMMGVTNGFAAGASLSVRYINIYNGQTGERIYRYDMGTSFTMGDPYHRAPGQLALADLDNDGIGEIVVATPNGMVRAFKPVFDGTTITGMNQMWVGKANGIDVSYAAPLTASRTIFGYPHPYIADLNGDGIPEVIVYNKIFNGATGALLMSWQNAAAGSLKNSSITGTNGLSTTMDNSPASEATASGIRNVAMTGRCVASGSHSDSYLAVPAIVDIDGDGQQEIITGNRIHKFQFNSLTNHTQNTYSTVEGPASATLPVTTNGATTTFYLSDGFTRVADIDGDGSLDIVTVAVANNGSRDVNILVYVWDPRYPNVVKAANTFYSDGTYGSFSIPFIGDINGKNDGWDGFDYNRKLPEICILGGGMYINRVNNNNGRSGILFHPLSDEKLRQGTAENSGTAAGWNNNQINNANRRFNRRPLGGSGHIIGLTYDAQATAVYERLKVSWGLEHADDSNNTGITLFDFDNNNTMDICYRDENTLRVISPKKGNNGAGSDYVMLNETESTVGSSIMFR